MERYKDKIISDSLNKDNNVKFSKQVMLEVVKKDIIYLNKIAKVKKSVLAV